LREKENQCLSQQTTIEEIARLKISTSSNRCVGMEVTIYDPTLDPAGKGADLIVNLLAEVFSPERREA